MIFLLELKGQEDKKEEKPKKIKKAKKYQLEDIFFGDVPNIDQLNKTLDRIIENIEGVKKIPFKKRYFDF